MCRKKAYDTLAIFVCLDLHHLCTQVNVRQLADLTRLVRGDLSNLGRRLLAALITIDVHSRDIVGSLLAKTTSNVNDFEWQMQLRYYFEEEDLVVRQVGSAMQVCWQEKKCSRCGK